MNRLSRLNLEEIVGSYVECECCYMTPCPRHLALGDIAALRAQVAVLTEALESLGIEVAEWHPINDCANEIYKLRTALERIRDEIDYSFDDGNPNKIRSIAIDALAKGDHEPF